MKTKYPSAIINKCGTPKDYVGIIFNGDMGVYRKDVIRCLKKKKDAKTKELIKAVKTAEGDLEISAVLIEANRYDVLVDVFNASDCRTAIIDYIEAMYQKVADKHRFTIMDHLAKFANIATSELNEQTEYSKVLEKIDTAVDEETRGALEELSHIHNEEANRIFDAYKAALVAKMEELKAVKTELNRMKEEIEGIKKNID